MHFTKADHGYFEFFGFTRIMKMLVWYEEGYNWKQVWFMKTNYGSIDIVSKGEIDST